MRCYLVALWSLLVALPPSSAQQPPKQDAEFPAPPEATILAVRKLDGHFGYLTLPTSPLDDNPFNLRHQSPSIVPRPKGLPAFNFGKELTDTAARALPDLEQRFGVTA